MPLSKVQPERILRELADLWASLAGTDAQSSGAGVLRACSMTLMVAAKDEQDATDVGQTVGELMHEHPSRAIVFKPAEAGAALDARVFAQCWMPFGSRQQICCEEIEITTPEDRLEQIARVIPGLLAPDLPAVLWCRGRTWFDRTGMERIYPLIDKIVLDSCAFPDVGAAFRTIDSLRRHRPVVGDLAWARLTDWREMVANAFEGPGARLIEAVREITVEYYGDSPSTSVYYLAAWLARAMPAATLKFHRAAGATGLVAGVFLAGDDVHIGFRRIEKDTVQVTGTTQLGTVVLPHATETHSMQEELTITGADPIFEDVYRRAKALRTLES